MKQRKGRSKDGSKAVANGGSDAPQTNGVGQKYEERSLLSGRSIGRYVLLGVVVAIVLVIVGGSLIALNVGQSTPPRTNAKQDTVGKDQRVSDQPGVGSVDKDQQAREATAKAEQERKRLLQEREQQKQLERDQERRDFDDGDTGVHAVVRCRSNFGSPSRLNLTQKCCEFRPGKFSCLPNLVIMGAQKSGTTTVHSYLLYHPQLRPAKKKEMHLFDFDKNFHFLKERVTMLIPGVDRQLVPTQMTIDSSPSYIADHKACPRMARVLSKDARFVLLLRDPVERVWSDILMKKRRVEAQTEFLQIVLPRFHKEIADCLNKCGSDCNLVKFRECLPADAGKHGKMSAFLKFIRSGVKEAVDFRRACLGSETATRKCLAGKFEDLVLREKMPPIPTALYDEAKYLTKQLEDCCVSENVTSSKPPLKRQNAFRSDEPIILDEADEETVQNYLNDGPWFPDSGDEYGMCRGCGCRCFPRAGMISDVAKYHLWRSLYFPQLVHCMATISRERILIVNNNDLRTNTQATMTRIFAHVGLPPVDVSKLTAEEIQNRFRTLYPDFEAISGWSVQGQDDEMPKELRTFLDNFFRPYNRKLFDMLKIEPFKGWAV